MNTFAFILVIYGLSVYVAHRVIDKCTVRKPEDSPLVHETAMLIVAFGWPIFLAVATLQCLHPGEKA